MLLFTIQAQEKGTIISKLQGIGLGSPWISPIDSLYHSAEYLLNMVNIFPVN